MAVDKTKIIQQAQKFIQGQKWDKAIECYEQLAKIEPKDTRVRQKIAELYARKGDIGKALQSYNFVAESYTREGFYQKALAVYKQMLQIKPDFVPAYEQLAEVSIKLGLNNDAINYIKVVIAQHEKDGKVLEALEAIKKLIEIDPDNIASQIKLAELYAREGHKEDAVNQLAALLPTLEQAQNWDDLLRLRERICHYDPGHPEHLKTYYRLLMKLGRYQPAFQPLQRYIKLNREDIEAIEDLAALLRQLGNGNHEKVALKELARRLGENADPARLEEIYSRILEIDPADQAAAEYLNALRSEMTTEDDSGGGEEVDIANDEMIGEEEMVADEELADDSENELIDEDVEIAGQEQIDNMLIGGAPAGGIQDDQLDAYLTEADVYVKYGLIDKAVTHLQKLLNSRPDHVPAYQKLQDVLNAGSRGAEFGVLVKAGIDLLRKQGKDASALEALLSTPRAAKPAPEAALAAAEAGIDPDIAAIVSEHPAIDDQISDELASAVGGALDATLEGSVEEAPVAAEAVEPESHDLSIEIDIDDSAHAAQLADDGAIPESLEIGGLEVETDAGNPLAGADLDSDLSFSTPELPVAEAPASAAEEKDFFEPDVPSLAAESMTVASPPSPPQASLEESEDAAQATLEAEQELASGPPPEFDEESLELSAPPPPSPAPAAEETKADTAKTPVAKPPLIRPPIIKPPSISKPVIQKPAVAVPPLTRLSVSVPSVKPPVIAKPAIASPAATPPKPVLPKPPLAKPALAKPSIMKPAAPGAAPHKPAMSPPAAAKPAIPKLAPLPKPGLPKPGLSKPSLSVPKPPVLKPLPTLHKPKFPVIQQKEPFAEDFEQVEFEIQQGLFDEARITLDMILAQDPNNEKAKAKLNELIAAEKTTREEASGNFTPEFGDGEQVSVESVLKAFQQGVDKTVAREDSQTRFDLGLAYREMGLFGEAEREFRLALDGNNARRPDCWTMIGLCQLEGGDPHAAALTFEQGLSDTSDPAPRYNLTYELANARMAAGEKETALGLLAWLDLDHPGFRQTSDLIARLKSEGVSSSPTPPPAPDPAPGNARTNVSYV